MYRIVYTTLTVLANLFFSESLLAQDFKRILPIQTFIFVTEHPQNVTMQEENLLLHRLKETFQREAKIAVDATNQFSIVDISPTTIQDYFSQPTRLINFKWFNYSFDFDTRRYNLLVDPPVLFAGADHVGGLAAVICGNPGPTANAVTQAHFFETPDIKHRIYRYELIQTHELAHLLGAHHTRAKDYDIMNTFIQSEILARNIVPVHFAARSIAEMRVCLQSKIRKQLSPRRVCEQKNGRKTKVNCYLRKAKAIKSTVAEI